MEKLSKTVAIKKYLEKDAKPFTIVEMSEFLKTCTDAEKEQFAQTAAAALGVEIAA